MNSAQRRLAWGLVMAITLAAFEALATATVMPAARDDLGGTALYGWAFSGFLLTSLIGIRWAGEQSDRHGPARPFMTGLTFFAIGLAIAGMAPEMWVLVLGRTVQGLGAGVVPPVAYVAVGRGFPDSARPRVLALFATAWVVPGLVGPGIAGVAAEFLSWRVAFLGIVPLVLLAGVLVVPTLRTIGPGAAGGPGTRARSQVRGAVLLAAGAGLILGGATARSVFVSPPLVVAGFAIAIPMLRRVLPPGSLRGARGLPAAVLGIGALNFAFFGADSFVPFMLTEVRGQSTLVAGGVVTAATLSWTSGTWLVDRMATKWERAAMVRWGQGLVAVGCLLIVPSLSESVPIAATIAAWCVAGMGIGIAYPNFSLITLAAAPAEEVGAVSSASKLSEALGAALGAGLAGTLVAAGEAGDWTAGALGVSFVLMAAVAAGGVGIAGRLPGARAVAASTGTSTVPEPPPSLAAGN